MKIIRLKIENFRSVKKGIIHFDDHTVLVGANNVGKTSIIEALALLFGRDRLVKNLTEHDFFGASPTEKDRFKITALLSDFPDNNQDSNVDWFRQGRAIPRWINPEDNTLHPEQTNQEWKLCAEIGIAGRFDHEELIVETIRYFVDSENENDPFDDENYIERFPITLLKETGFFLVPASRTWDKMLSFSSELFRRVVTTFGSVPAKAILKQRDQVRKPDVKIEEENEIKELFNAVNNELGLLFNNAPKSLLRLTGTNSESVLNTLIPHFQNNDEDIPIPSVRQGSGIVSMQNLLLLLQLGRLRKEKNQNFLVAIEEPELHIPPSQQRRLTNRLKACCQQTIVTTHSPDIASEFEPHSIRVLENHKGLLEAKPLIESKLTPDESNPVRQLIQWQKREAINSLMHERLLIPEGKGDCNWLTMMAKGIEIDYDYSKENSNLFSGSVGIFPTDSAAVEKVFELLSKAHSNTFCLVDGDKAGKDYITNLKKLAKVPKRILMWPTDLIIEDIIGKILKSDEEAFLPKIKELIEDESLLNIDAFIVMLKLKHKNNNGGRKDDYLLHEEIVKLIFSTEKGKKAASELIESILDATEDTPASKGFVKDATLSDDNVEVFVYSL